MVKPRQRRAPPSSVQAGVPLGGIGTGCIELGEDARFSNVSINNNRTTATRIPVAQGAFIAIRAARGGESVTRILQPDSSIPFKEAGLSVRYTRPDEQTWYGLYPSSNYLLKTEDFPLELHWSCLSPVIPYDTEASTLPLLMCVLHFKNTTDDSYSVSGLFNWENLRGCTADKTPDERGTILPVTYIEIDETLFSDTRPPVGMEDVPMRAAGLSFGLHESAIGNADGNYCLVAAPSDGTHITLASWRRKSKIDIQRIWESFEGMGTLPEGLSTDPQAHCGSVCSATTIAPGETRRLLFVLTWYCPRYVVEGQDLGNHYASEHVSAVGVAEYGLKHSHYFLRAIANWQERFTKSSLPLWYSRMLVNNCHVFSTNTLLTRDGEFSMMESPRDPVMGMLDRSFYSSIATVLFFPGFAERELELFARKIEDGSASGRMVRELGHGTVRNPGFGDPSNELIDLGAKFVLMAYRNFQLTGKTVALISLFPRLREVMEYAMQLDRDRDGIPDARGNATTFGGWAMYGLTSYAGGLWIAAMHAYARLARHLKHDDEAEIYEARARHALRHFERRLWNEKEGYYRLYHDPAGAEENHPVSDDGCLGGQLAGAWYADFLNIDAGFSHQRIVRAIESIERFNRRPSGIALGYDPRGAPCRNPPGHDTEPDSDQSWPSHSVSYIACMSIYRGNVDKGMEVLRTVYQSLSATKPQRIFSQPLAWDPDRNEPTGPQQERHMGPLSIWHSFYALQGFSLSVPEQKMTIAPRLPSGVNHLSVPLFTPLTFGWLTYTVTHTPSYRQQLSITFDSPMFIKIIEVSVPKSIANPVVRLLINEDQAAIQTELIAMDPDNRIRITLDQPLQVQLPIDLSVT